MKYFASLVLALSLCIGAIPASTEALSNDVVVFQIQTGSSTNASHELIILKNVSENPVNISNWCLFYSSASNVTIRTLACIDTQPQTEVWINPLGLVSFASGEFVIANSGFVPDATFQSGISGTSGHVWIENASSSTIDRVGWGSAVLPETAPALAHSAGSVLSRNDTALIDTDNNQVDFSSRALISPIVSGLYEVAIIVDVCPNVDEVQTNIPLGYLQDETGDCYEDACPNLEELQKDIPIGYEKRANDCSKILLEKSVLLITELLPNASSSDTGKEFIEIYNPNPYNINLAGYEIQIGPGFTKQFRIEGGIIGPAQYVVYSDIQSSIVLPNTNGVQLRLVAPSGDIVSETPVYSNAPDDSSWVFIDDQWIYTNQPTPASTNQPYLAPAEDEEISITTVLAPCPVGKYRNPETNRCRTIETAVSSLSPCNEDEYRNPETNRCRKVASGSVLAACAVGQERNPETNRCRKISSLTSVDTALASVKDIEVESTPGQVNWLIILVTLTATCGYILYEWRNEIHQKYRSIRY